MAEGLEIIAEKDSDDDLGGFRYMLLKELWFPKGGNYRGPHSEQNPPIQANVNNAIGNKIEESGWKFGVFFGVQLFIPNGLLNEYKMRKDGNFYMLYVATDGRLHKERIREKEYGDLSNQIPTMKAERASNHMGVMHLFAMINVGIKICFRRTMLTAREKTY